MSLTSHPLRRVFLLSCCLLSTLTASATTWKGLDGLGGDGLWINSNFTSNIGSTSIVTFAAVAPYATPAATVTLNTLVSARTLSIESGKNLTLALTDGAKLTLAANGNIGVGADTQLGGTAYSSTLRIEGPQTGAATVEASRFYLEANRAKANTLGHDRLIVSGSHLTVQLTNSFSGFKHGSSLTIEDGAKVLSNRATDASNFYIRSGDNQTLHANYIDLKSGELAVKQMSIQGFLQVGTQGILRGAATSPTDPTPGSLAINLTRDSGTMGGRMHAVGSGLGSEAVVSLASLTTFAPAIMNPETGVFEGPGTLQLSANLKFSTNSNLEFGIFGNGENDKIVFTSLGKLENLGSGAVISIFLRDDFVPTAGQSWQLFDMSEASTGAIVGNFNLTKIDEDLWDLSAFNAEGGWRIVAIPEPMSTTLLLLAGALFLLYRKVGRAVFGRLTLVALAGSGITACKKSSADEVALVRNGAPAALVLLPEGAGLPLQAAAQRFIQTVERGTGATLPLEQETGQGPPTSRSPARTIIHVGATREALAKGKVSHSLPPETYHLVVEPGAVYIQGSDPLESGMTGVSSRPVQWALNALLEEGLGVRWLWPGELGTYIPTRRDMAVSRREVTYQPRLELRSLRAAPRPGVPLAVETPEVDRKLKNELIEWCENHQAGRRSIVPFGHNYGKWWERFGATHPDYFAQLLPEFSQPFPAPHKVKLRLANPAVIEQIARDYIAAGKPKYWNVCPNDGSGFDVSPETTAWDLPPGQNPADIFSARGKLTARYVQFWNLLYARLKELNPEVILATYAYSSYRDAPTPERPLSARAIVQLVDSMDAYETWRGWAAQGVDLFLRPNWWHQGADAPYLSYRKTGDFIHFAWKQNMLGIDMDSVLGYWGTQGINYYVTARLMTRPDLSVDQVVDEYLSAFGSAGEVIREYLQYWEKLSDGYNFEDARQESRFFELVKTKKIPSRSVLNGSKYALPHLYPDDVLAPALEILQRASGRVDGREEEAARRVDFLRNGLLAMKATRDQVALGNRLRKAPTPQHVEEFQQHAAQLETLRERLSREHVVWAHSMKIYEKRYKILIWPEEIHANQINLDGM